MNIFYLKQFSVVPLFKKLHVSKINFPLVFFLFTCLKIKVLHWKRVGLHLHSLTHVNPTCVYSRHFLRHLNNFPVTCSFFIKSTHSPIPFPQHRLFMESLLTSTSGAHIFTFFLIVKEWRFKAFRTFTFWVIKNTWWHITVDIA